MNKVNTSRIKERIVNLILILLISSPIWVLLIFHFLPDKISVANLYQEGVKTKAKVEFYSKEKEAGSGKLGGLNTHNIIVANYFYYDRQNNLYKGKIKSSVVKILRDSVIQILYLEKNPNHHLVINTDGKGKLGQTRN
ncbi:hypothetical protein [Arenibacter palladensis]|uniref:hypothetical protein n=1 Tax=Arenibacter palladensis TaxID=237373 RepID=UPI0026E3B4D0|nr:hypothetical protein [Arenibacter palladensis]MDO6602503.1 hypothetical protein [Arenibacter palladensis]|tara:strand:+ start:4601 stop:5014 length:414 start_codon:yes stop_codon:yes gene_type:complete